MHASLPFLYPQNNSYGVFKYEKLNYSYRILNIKKITISLKKKFVYIFFFKQKLVWAEKVVRAPTRTMSVIFFGLINSIN